MQPIKDLLVRCKAFFYDTYSGWKKRRVVLFMGSAVAGVLLIVLLAVVTTPEGDLLESLVVFDNLTLPDFGKKADNLPEQTDKGTDTNTKEVIINTEVQGDTVYGPPVFGDIVSFGGVAITTEDAVPIDSETVAGQTGKYTSWGSIAELRTSVRRSVEKVQDEILFYMDTAVEQGGWAEFASDASLILLDTPAIGEQVRTNLSSAEVAVWEELELVYLTFYSELYTCTSIEDIQKVANSNTRQQAIDLTARFIEVVADEADNLS